MIVSTAILADLLWWQWLLLSFLMLLAVCSECHFHEPSEQPRSDFILWLAQGFDTGRMPIAPGTFGSLVGLVWFIALLATGRIELYIAGTIAGVALSIWICGAAEKILRQKDPGSVVLDEIIALPIVFLPWLVLTVARGGNLPSMDWLLTGRGLLTLTAGFLLFRLFDIWKPWPVRQIQDLPGGWGVTADDVVAAVYAGLGVLLLNSL